MSLYADPIHVFRRFTHLMPRHWQRRRGSLGPSHVVLSLMMMSVLGCQGYECTITEMKKELGDALGWDPHADTPSAAALCQARRKLSTKNCTDLVSQVYDLCTSARTCASVGYGGFRLLALDGTQLALPAYAAFKKHFGCPSNQGQKELSCPQASLLLLWDVGANQPVAWDVGPYRTAEKTQANLLAEVIGPGDLVLGDRNFPSRRFLTLAYHRKAHVLMRARTDQMALHAFADFFASGENDKIVEIESRNEHGRIDPAMPTIRIRLIRSRRDGSADHVYVTTLCDQDQHPAAALIELYHHRWRIETAFRELKLWHGLERFHARHVAGIAQEIAAMMIFQLLASELAAQVKMQHAAKEEHENQREKSNNTTAPAVSVDTIRFNRRIVADCTISLIKAAAANRNIKEAFDDAMQRIWRYKQKVRPGRSFTRIRKSAQRGWRNESNKKKT